MRVEVLVWIKDKIRGWYLGRHMDHLADSIAKLNQGRENWYIGREGIPVDDSYGEKCEPVIVFECIDLSIGHHRPLESSALTCSRTADFRRFPVGLGTENSNQIKQLHVLTSF